VADLLAGAGEPGPPVVTVRGGPSEQAPDPRTAAVLRTTGLVLAGLALVLAVLQGQREERPRLERPEVVPVAASVRVVSRAVTVSQGGVLVVPVVLQDLGPGLAVVEAQAYAEPVREDPVTTAPDGLEAGQARRFVVLLTPECGLLTTRSRLAFRASLLLRVEQGGDRRQLVLDLGADESVARFVEGLCRRSSS
jgi:hypothetical protein